MYLYFCNRLPFVKNKEAVPTFFTILMMTKILMNQL